MIIKILCITILSITSGKQMGNTDVPLEYAFYYGFCHENHKHRQIMRRQGRVYSIN